MPPGRALKTNIPIQTIRPPSSLLFRVPLTAHSHKITKSPDSRSRSRGNAPTAQYSHHSIRPEASKHPFPWPLALQNHYLLVPYVHVSSALAQRPKAISTIQSPHPATRIPYPEPKRGTLTISAFDLHSLHHVLSEQLRDIVGVLHRRRRFVA